MNCRGVQFRLSAYLDGELGGMEMLQLRSHLHDCPACSLEADQVRQLKAILVGLPDEEPDFEFQSRLKEKVFAAQKQPAIASRLSLAVVSGFAFATALSFGLVFLHQLHQPSRSIPLPKVVRSTPPMNFDLERDQAYQSAGDPFNDGSMVLTASASTNGALFK